MPRKPQSLDELLVQIKEHGPGVLKTLKRHLSLEDAELLSSCLKDDGYPVEPFDLPGTMNIWATSGPNANTNAKAYARQATKQLIEGMAREKGVDYRTVEGFKQILPKLTQHTFKTTPINTWGTKLGGMFQIQYRGSPSEAVLDLITTDTEFQTINQQELQPYDFNTPKGTWTPDKPNNLARQATKKLIQTLATQEGVDYRTTEGFKKILPKLTQHTFKTTPINTWGTKLGGILQGQYHHSPREAVLDLIHSDTEFETINQQGLEPYDFPRAPKGTWTPDKPNTISRQATKKLIQTLATQEGADYSTIEGFKKILPKLTQHTFKTTPINTWGTTIGDMLASQYRGSPSKAVLDLIHSDPEFETINQQGLEPYDFNTPRETWTPDKPNTIARQTTKKLIQTLATQDNVNYRTIEGFKKILPKLTGDAFDTTPINTWGTTLGGMLTRQYHGSPSEAVLDLIHSDPEFETINQQELQPYDFNTPHGTWTPDKPNTISRQATKKLIQTLATQEGVDYRTIEGFKKILPKLTADTFYTTPINTWGTTLRGMLNNQYRGSPSEAVFDLVSKDPEFKNVKRSLPSNSLKGHCSTRIARAEGNYSFHLLRKALREDGLSLGNYGFYTFAHGEKQTVRELLAEEAERHFGERPIAYFGLEGPSFGSYFALAQLARIDSGGSLIPEREPRNYNLMKRITTMRSVNNLLNGSSLYNLELTLETAENALTRTSKQFDLIFLDWLGHISPAGVRELELAYDRLNEGGLLAVTVNMKPFSEGRYRQQTGQSITQDESMHEFATEKGLAISDVEYIGGDKRKTPMTLYLMIK